MSKHRIGCFLIAGVLLVGCGVQNQGSPGGAKQGGTLHVAIGIDPDTLDPAQQTTTTVSQIVDMVDETLVTIDRNGKVAPLLATSWTNGSDGLSYTFTLRSGVKFHDGTDFNADAVKFSIDRLLSSNTLKAQPGVLRAIKETQVTDATHVKFILGTPLAPFVAAMTQTQAAIISPKSVNVEGNSAANVQVPVGTGPYKWKERVKAASTGVISQPHFASESPISVTLCYFPDEPMQGDIDNIVKPILDALGRHIYIDDRQIQRILVQKFEPGNVFSFTEPTPILGSALEQPKPALYIRVSDDPFEDLA